MDRSLIPFQAAAVVERPVKGWLKAVRTASAIQAREVAARLGGSPQLVLQQEKAEAEDRITLKNLRKMANALDCDLVYAIVPRAKDLGSLMEARARAEAQKNVSGIEHTMLLEDQAAGHLEEAVAMETERILAKKILLT